MSTIGKISVKDYLKKEGLEITRNTLVPYNQKESFQFCIDVVDTETGDVFSYIGTEGESEAFATNEESFQAYQKDLIITTEL